jgi:hypothetical protein
LRGTWRPYEKKLMSVQRQRAACAVEVEAAIDQVKGCRSNEWFRAMMHQDVLRKVGQGGGPRVTDDDGNVISPGPRDAGHHERRSSSRPYFVHRTRAWLR